MKKAYLIDFIGFMIAKAKNISHLFSMAYVNSGNRCLFDNLPFVPALQVLGHIQVDHAGTFHDWQILLQGRYDHPDLFLVGALNERVEPDADTAYDTLPKAHSRASRLSNNEKILGYVRASLKIDRQIDRLLQSQPQLLASQKNIINNVVNAAVLPVYPADTHH